MIITNLSIVLFLITTFNNMFPRNKYLMPLVFGTNSSLMNCTEKRGSLLQYQV